MVVQVEDLRSDVDIDDFNRFGNHWVALSENELWFTPDIVKDEIIWKPAKQWMKDAWNNMTNRGLITELMIRDDMYGEEVYFDNREDRGNQYYGMEGAFSSKGYW